MRIVQSDRYIYNDTVDNLNVIESFNYRRDTFSSRIDVYTCSAISANRSIFYKNEKFTLYRDTRTNFIIFQRLRERRNVHFCKKPLRSTCLTFGKITLRRVFPTDDEIHVNLIAKTILKVLGIDYEKKTIEYTG